MIKGHPLATWLVSLNSYVHLDAAEQAEILDLTTDIRECHAGQSIVREGDVAERCAILVDGFAVRMKLTAIGGKAIVGFQIPGDALDLQHLYLDCADHNVEMLTPGRLAYLQGRDLRALAAERPAIAVAFGILNQLDGSILREWLVNVGRRNAQQRVAHLFCELAVRLERHGLSVDHGFELPLTQQQLGDALGLTSVHVNRSIKALEMAGLIQRTHKIIRVPDWRKLTNLAGFNAIYLHLTQRQVDQAFPEMVTATKRGT